jgi:hypothetical protein
MLFLQKYSPKMRYLNFRTITISLETSVTVNTVRSNKKKIRVGENGGLNQSKHQNSTIQVPNSIFF